MENDLEKTENIGESLTYVPKHDSLEEIRAKLAEGVVATREAIEDKLRQFWTLFYAGLNKQVVFKGWEEAKALGVEREVREALHHAEVAATWANLVEDDDLEDEGADGLSFLDRKNPHWS